MKQMTAAFDAAKEGSKRVGALFVVLAAAMALVMASALPASAQGVTVEGADGNVWDPDSIEVEAGTTVTFDMTGGDAMHNGVLDDGTEAFDFVDVGDSVDYTFEEEGEFVLSCTIHPGMDLDVTVTAAGDNGQDQDPADEGEDQDPADENGQDPADEDEGTPEDDDEDVEVPSSVDSGTGGLVSNGMPLWLGAVMALGVLALAVPAVASRRR